VPIPAAVTLGLLAQCVNQNQVAFEPYRNPVEVDDIQTCVIKILEVQQELNRLESQPMPQAFMWIITPTSAQHKLNKFGAVCDEAVWGKGLNLMSAKDIFHGSVKRGLVKDGWTITADPLELEWEGVTVEIDIAADSLISASPPPPN
jgi:hypothetical protein